MRSLDFATQQHLGFDIQKILTEKKFDTWFVPSINLRSKLIKTNKIIERNEQIVIIFFFIKSDKCSKTCK